MTSALVITLATGVTGLVLMYFLVRRSFRREAEQLRSKLQEAIKASRAVNGGQMQVKMALTSADAQATTPTLDCDAIRTSDELDHETLSAIGLSVSTLLGKSVRISPVGATLGPSTRNLWAQEGCLSIQNSHELQLARRANESAIHVRKLVAKAASANRSAA
jgi:hypothetical protein